MGANGSYDKRLGGVPKGKRTHLETGYSILGYKVLIQKGNLIPFNGKESASHSHKWIERPDGKMARKPASNGENTHLPIPDEYTPLSDAIVKFNIQKHKYPKK